MSVPRPAPAYLTLLAALAAVSGTRAEDSAGGRPLQPSGAAKPSTSASAAPTTSAPPPQAEPPLSDLRLLWPAPGMTVSVRRPSLRFARPSTTGLEVVDLCSDRSCKKPIFSLSTGSAEVAPAQDLPAGTVFWRVRSGARTTATWSFTVPAHARSSGPSADAGTDVDGDGHADTVIIDGDAAKLHAGSPSGLVPRGTILVAPPGSADRAQLFASPVGDVDGDGLADWGVTVFADKPAGVFVYSGGPGGLSHPVALAQPRGAAREMVDFLAAAGDVDGDGYGDVLVSTSGDDDPSFVRVAVHHGGPGGVSRDPRTQLALVNATSESWPRQVVFGAPAGDVNGDGFADVLVVAPDGTVRLHRGGPGGLELSPAVTLAVAEGWPRARGARGLGDIDGDGFADVGIEVTRSNPMVAAPGLQVHRGGPAGTSTIPAQTLWGRGGIHDPFISPRSPAVVAPGDIDGDGYADVLLAGSLHRGGPDGLSARPIVTLAGRSARSLEVVPIGDANADGRVEVIVVQDGGVRTLHLGNKGGLPAQGSALAQ